MKKSLRFFCTILAILPNCCFAACDGFYLGIQGGGAKTHYDKHYRPEGVVEK